MTKTYEEVIREVESLEDMLAIQRAVGHDTTYLIGRIDALKWYLGAKRPQTGQRKLTL